MDCVGHSVVVGLRKVSILVWLTFSPAVFGGCQPIGGWGLVLAWLAV